jgi:hypothetical protein
MPCQYVKHRSKLSKHQKVNHSTQMNPNNAAYWEARGWDARPEDWEARFARGETVETRSGYQATKLSVQQASNASSFEKWLGKTTTISRYSYLDDDDE